MKHDVLPLTAVVGGDGADVGYVLVPLTDEERDCDYVRIVIEAGDQEAPMPYTRRKVWLVLRATEGWEMCEACRKYTPTAQDRTGEQSVLCDECFKPARQPHTEEPDR